MHTAGPHFPPGGGGGGRRGWPLGRVADVVEEIIHGHRDEPGGGTMAADGERLPDEQKKCG